MKTVIIYFLLFIIYSIMGWIFETIVTTIGNKKLINRGFLIGPYLPIYGTGALAVIILLKPYHNDFVALFIMSVVVCSIIEYLTSYLMEKLFKARWWDYTDRPFNVNGRICLPFSLAFGLLGSIIVIVNMHIYNFLNNANNSVLLASAIISFVIFTIDIIVSFNIINKIKLSANNMRKDYSEEIAEKVSKTLASKSILIKRLLKAFPNIKLLQRKK